MSVQMLRTGCALLIALLMAVLARAEVSTPVGVWVDANQRVQVEIAPCGDRLCGEIVWFRWPKDAEGLPLVDLKNPDPALHSRPLLGLRVLDGLRRSGKSTWGDGRIYNPDDGIDYHAEMSIGDDGTLRVRAYRVLPIYSAKPEIARDGKNDDNHYRAEGIGEPAFAMAVPMTGKRGDIGWLDARDIAIVAPAFVASSDQRRGQLLLDQLLNEIPDPIPRLRRLQISATSATPLNRILECGRPKSVHFA